MNGRRSGELRFAGQGALLVAVVVVLACAGCGSSSKPSPSVSSSSATQAAASQLIARADAICNRLNANLGPRRGAHVGNSEIARSAPQHAALERRALSELSKLTPPAPLVADWRKILGYRRTLMVELLTLGRYAETNNAAAIRAVAVGKERVHTELFDTATRDGFKDCSRIGPGGNGRSAHSSPTHPPQARIPA